MFIPPFCPYKECRLHTHPPPTRWWQRYGFHGTQAHGPVQRFRCVSCGRTFSVQTFSVHYYTKRLINLEELERRASSSMSMRALGRDCSCTVDTILNRLDRLARQGIALHSALRPKADPSERVCFDGLVSFERSQYYPCDIGISITAHSRFVLGLSHSTTRRSGRMTTRQRETRARLDRTNRYERRPLDRSLTEHLDMLKAERPFSAHRPLILITDEKREYVRTIRVHSLYRDQDDDHRMMHLQVSSRAPRNYTNPLFASNYYDREVRKDQAQHRRETACFARDASTGMSRLYVHLVYHNYVKRYLINQPTHITRTAAEVAGVPGSDIRRLRSCFFTRRAFLSKLLLQPIDLKIWLKELWDPVVGGLRRAYTPRFALA